jgi:hypothetical protein
VPGAETSENGEEPAPTTTPPAFVEPIAAEEPVEPTDGAEAVAEEAPADGTSPKKRKTRRGSRGGRNRRKKPAAAAPAETSESG